MISRRNREYITIQLLQTQEMLAILNGHPIMSYSLKQKEEYLIEQLEKLPIDQKDDKIVLLFNGNPVKGSIGIDASFIGKITIPFQSMVTADFAYKADGKVGKRGQFNRPHESKLFLTALPRGSFGIELSKLETSNLFDRNQMANTLSYITKLIESSAKSDDDFAVAIEGTTPRTIQCLKDFFKVIADEQAGFSIESGGIRCELNPDQVRIGYERASDTITSEAEKIISGTLKGVLLQSWKFDFMDSEGNSITGKIDENLSEDEISVMNAQYFNKPCKAIVKEGKVVFKNGSERISYVLINIT